MLKKRQELEENLINAINQIKNDKKIVADIKRHLEEYEILAGDVQGYVGDAEKELPELDPRLLFLLNEAVYKVAGNDLGETVLTIIPEEYFTEQEIKTSRQYSGELEREDMITLPMTFDNVSYLGNGIYMTVLSAKLIKELMDSMLLHYNFNTQREAKVKHVRDQVVYQPTVNQNNIVEMVEHLKNDTLYPFQLVINAGIRTSDTGQELEYKSNKSQLVVNPGTKLDIVDGYHRCKAIQNALEVNPNIEMNFPVMITNLTDKAAQRFLGQMSKAMPISKARSQELNASRLSDDVVQQLKEESELKGRISQTETVHRSTNELVSYSVLADTIDEEFEMNTKADAMDVSDYLIDFFNYLLGSFPEEFMSNAQETRNHSLINQNNIIGVGYVALAKRMQDEGIKYRKVKDIISSINFSRENPMWVELGILDEKGTITNVDKTRKNIKEYFKTLDIEKLIEEKV